jgi:hypothetical protein
MSRYYTPEHSPFVYELVEGKVIEHTADAHRPEAHKGEPGCIGGRPTPVWGERLEMARVGCRRDPHRDSEQALSK